MRNLPIRKQETMIGLPDHVEGDYVSLSHSSPNNQSDNFKYYLNILKHRILYIIFPVFIFMPITLAYLAIEEPVYTSRARILIENDESKVLEIQELVTDDKTRVSRQTEFNLIKTRENLDEVVTTLKLDQKKPPEDPQHIKIIKSALGFPRKLKRYVLYYPKKILANLQAQIETPQVSISDQTPSVRLDPEELRRLGAVDALGDAISVSPVGDTRLVDIKVSGSNPYEIAQQANTLIDIYARKNLENRLEASRRAIDWLTKKTSELKEKMYVSELELQKYRRTKDFVSFDFEERDNIVHKELSLLHGRFSQVRAERADAETKLNNVRELLRNGLENVENIASISKDTFILSIKQKYMSLKDEYSKLREIYKPGHPRMVQLTAQLDQIERVLGTELRRIVDNMEVEYGILRGRENRLRQELDRQKDKSLGLNSDMIAYHALKSEAENQRDLYLEAAKRLQEIKLTQALVTNNVKIVERATVPLTPISSKRSMKLMLSVVLGCTIGVGLAFIREYFDNKFKDGGDIEYHLRLPILVVIPDFGMPKNLNRGPITLHAPSSEAAELYRLLRTRLQSCAPTLKSLMVTSAVPSEGKSTTTANLGVIFSRLGFRVVLLDTDLRRPTLHRHFQQKNDGGLSTILSQNIAWQQVIQDTSIENLKLLSAGNMPANPSDLLSLRAIHALMDDLKGSFDLVIVDSPAALSVPDVESLASGMEGILVVHCPDACDKNTILDLKRSLDRIQSNILGVVLNNIRMGDLKNYSSHGYYGYYGTYYKNITNNQALDIYRNDI